MVKKSCQHVLILLLLFIITPKVFAHGEEELFKLVEVRDGSSLSVMDCVAVAFKNSPKIKRQKYNLDIAKSNLGIAKAQYFPVINAGIGFYNENNSDNIYYNSHYRELPSVGLSINKMIWDFGRTTAYIKMEEFYKIGAEYEFIDSLCATLFDIKAKYYNLLKAEALRDIAEYNVELNEKFLNLAKGRKKYDRTAAEVNLSDSKVRLIEAQNNFRNERVNLANSMYMDSQYDFDIKHTKTFEYNSKSFPEPEKYLTEDFTPQIFPFTKEEALQIAYDNSPDLSVLISTRDAMEQSLLFIKRSYMPALSANAGYGYNNSTQTSNNSLQVGVNHSASTNLMELKHSIKGGEAQVNLADNEILLFKKDLYYELKRAFNNIYKTENEIPAAKMEVLQGFANLKLVEEQYKNNNLNYVALQEARKDYIKALQNYVESLYNYNMALIQIEMAMHCHIVDIHHKSEHAMHYHSQELVDKLNKALGCDETELKKPKKHFGRKAEEL